MVYPIITDRSKGSRLWDIDGNEYVYALNGFGMNLFGWQPDFVVDAIRKQIDAGYEIGPQHPLAGIVAKQICELTGFDRDALCQVFRAMKLCPIALCNKRGEFVAHRMISHAVNLAARCES